MKSTSDGTRKAVFKGTGTAKRCKHHYIDVLGPKDVVGGVMECYAAATVCAFDSSSSS